MIDGRFRFRSLDVDAMATEFTVIAHTAERRATPESNVHREPLPGSITSISPDHGYIEGGETIRICGSRIATDAIAPQVWFGNHAARVVLWSDECVTVTTPPSVAGPTDVALLLRGARPVIATDAFEYRTVRLVNLQQGWNLVVWTGADTRVTTAFASLAGSSFRAYSWDPDRQDWEIFSTELPPRLNTLRTIKHDQPLWILLETEDIDWPQPAPTKPPLPHSPAPPFPCSPSQGELPKAEGVDLPITKSLDHPPLISPPNRTINHPRSQCHLRNSTSSQPRYTQNICTQRGRSHARTHFPQSPSPAEQSRRRNLPHTIVPHRP